MPDARCSTGRRLTVTEGKCGVSLARAKILHFSAMLEALARGEILHLITMLETRDLRIFDNRPCGNIEHLSIVGGGDIFQDLC